MEPIRVLVTGAGSGVGQGIIKALRISGLPTTVVAADISPMCVGLYRGDESAVTVPVESPGALQSMCRLLRDRAINVLMVGSEYDLAFFSKHRAEIEAVTGVMVCASPEATVAIADDKLRTTEFLAAHGLPHARAIAPTTLEEARQAARSFGLPAVLKSRSGTSARNVHIVRSLEDIDRVFESVPDPMVQEFAGAQGDGLEHEYTCSVFTCADQQLIGPFTARRTLRGGTSWQIEVGPFEWLHELVLGVARNLPSVGSVNVQLRDGPKGPVPFEINARFSGTTAVRAHFGFNEPAMFLQSWYLGQPISPPRARRGMAMRYLEEVFIEGVGAKDLVEPLPRGEVRPWF